VNPISCSEDLSSCSCGCSVRLTAEKITVAIFYRCGGQIYNLLVPYTTNYENRLSITPVCVPSASVQCTSVQRSQSPAPSAQTEPDPAISTVILEQCPTVTNTDTDVIVFQGNVRCYHASTTLGLVWKTKPNTTKASKEMYYNTKIINAKLAATLRGSRPGVQTTLVIMTSLMTS